MFKLHFPCVACSLEGLTYDTLQKACTELKRAGFTGVVFDNKNQVVARYNTLSGNVRVI